MINEAAYKEKRNAAATSVVAALVLTAIKLIVGLLTRSLGLLAEAAHSGLDLMAAIITLLAIRISDRPPDEAHTYGHGKIENVSALIETLLLFATCAWIVFESVRRLFFQTVEVEPSFWAFLVVMISIVVDINRSKLLKRVAKKHSSQALEADALHFSTDIWSSAVVFLGLAMVWLGRNVFPGYQSIFMRADAVAALFVAVIVFFVSFRLGRRTVDVLVDRAPDGLKAKVSAAALEVDGVMNANRVRMRRSGPRVFIDMTIDVDRNLSFEKTHAIAEEVEARILEFLPDADIVIHADPRESQRETLARRVRTVADNTGLSVHNITVVEIGQELDIDLHLEVDDKLRLHQAHKLADRFERKLKTEIPGIRRITTHLESRITGVDNGVDITAEDNELMEKVRSIADQIAGCQSTHNIVIRRHKDGYSVSLHCRFKEDIPVSEAHGISTRIEDALKKEIPGVDRVVIHTEPEAG